MIERTCLATAILLGVAAVGNGLYMLVGPASWYVFIPGVTTTGPFNQHFLRDIGLIFVLLGAAFVAGAARPRDRTLLWGGATIWLCGHALFHVWEVLVGICGPLALVRDFGAVSMPALIGIGLTTCAARRHATA